MLQIFEENVNSQKQRNKHFKVVGKYKSYLYKLSI
jgi:hypothetical protein